MYLRLLDNPALVIDDEVVPLSTREAAFVGYLWETSPRAVRRARLGAMLWPRSTEQRALASLSQLIYQIRRKAAAIPLRLSDHDVSIEACRCDIDDVRRHVKTGSWLSAVATFKRPVLAGIELPSTQLESWRSRLDAEMAGLMSTALMEGLCNASSDADYELVVDRADTLIQEQHLHPGIAEARTCALLHLGRDIEAMAAHERLQGDIGDLFTIRDYQTLRDIVLATKAVAEAPVPVARFVGRGSELASLNRLWGEVSSGSGQAVLLSGEPGIGKTRLAEQFLRRVAISGGRVLMARCHVATRRSPYAVITDLITQNDLLSDTNLPLELRATMRRLITPSESDWATGSTDHWNLLTHSALSRLLSELASRRPVAIFIDDVQWADDSSAQVLTLWGLHVPAYKVCLLLTARTQDADVLPDWLEYDFSGVHHIPLGQLSVEAAGELLDGCQRDMRMTITPQQRNRILWQSAGRPLLLIEALRSVVQSSGRESAAGAVFLPESAEQVLRRRLRGLTNDSAWLMGLAAAQGSSLTPRSIAETSGLDDERVVPALELLCARGILEFADGRLRFPHDLLRETAYRSIAPATRTLLHKRVASVLESRSADEGLLADHYSAAGENAKAASFALTAARKAKGNGLFADSAHYYGIAVTHGSERLRAEAATELARQLAQAGRLDEADTGLVEALRECESAEARILADLVDLEAILGRGSAREALDRASGILEHVSVLRAADLGLTVGLLLDLAHDAGNQQFASELLRKCNELTTQHGTSQFDLEVGCFAAAWAGATDGYEAGLKRIGAISDDSIIAAGTSTQTLAWCAKGTLMLLAGELHAAVSTLEVALRLAREIGDLRRAAAASMNMAIALTELGEFREAQNSLEGLLASPNRAHKLRALTNLAILHYESGADALALSAVHSTLSTNSSYKAAKYNATAPAIAGLVALRQSDVVEAEGQYAWLTQSCALADYMLGDVGYIVPFVASMHARQGKLDSGLAVLDTAYDHIAGRDVLGALRLRITRAEILIDDNPDGAYAMARDVHDQAIAIGAHNIARRSSTLLARLR